MRNDILIKTLFETGAVVSFSEAKRLVAMGGGHKAGEVVLKAERLMMIAHAGVLDKSDVPYWKHPTAVANLMLEYETNFVSDEMLAVALLHDVVEDTETTLEDLAKIFSADVVDGVDGVTRRPGESWNDYFKRFSVEPIAKVVKKYDLIHNMDLTRMKTITVEDVRRTERYARTLKKLMKLEEV